jgi:hypothetical protein
VALEVPAVITMASKRRRAAADPRQIRQVTEDAATLPATDDRKPAIVTIRRKSEKILPPGLLPDTPEEHQRRGDAADALRRELVRRAAGRP